MSRERISEIIAQIEKQAAEALKVQIGSVFVDRDALKALLTTCDTLRHLLKQDGRYGYVIEQVGRVQGALRSAVKPSADPRTSRSELDNALARLTFAWQQTASWAPAASPSG